MHVKLEPCCTCFIGTDDAVFRDCFQLKERCRRGSSVTPNITENLFALGVGDSVVGVTSWCAYPPEATERTVIGDAFSLNMEVLLSLQPDIVISDSNLVAQTISKQLQSLGIEVASTDPTTVEGSD